MTNSGQNWGTQFTIFTCWAVGGAIGTAVLQTFAFVNCAVAQITPDSTLPNNSTVTPPARTRFIRGGTQAGNNLFHSFSEFSVPTGSIAYFDNLVDIQNIITRVTGSSISKIDGLIETNGTANLFLINPNGIIFGKNASLLVGGSFVATTANAVQFGDRGFFSADNPNAPSLLTVNPSALLFNQISATSTIQNNSTTGLGFNLTGRSLLLVGGKVSMDGGKLSAPGGRVELGGLAEAGTVGLNVNGNNLSLNFPDAVEKADVSLTNQAEVDVINNGGGSIAVNASKIDVLGGSNLRAGIRPDSQVNSAQPGDITLNATGTVKIQDSSIYNIVLGSGTGGNLNINTGQLIIQDGVVGTATFSQGRAGDLVVNAKDSVKLTGDPSSDGTLSIPIPIKIDRFSLEPIRVPIGLFSVSTDGQIFKDQRISSVLTGGGNAGELTITTQRLTVRNGAIVSAGTTTKGNAGTLTVKADSIELSGTSAKDFPSDSPLINFVSRGGRVPSGFQNGTAGSGSGGELIVNTRQLIVENGAWVGTNASGAGSTGILTVNATESVELSGTSSTGVFSFLATATKGSGDAKELTINTKRLIVKNGAIISAGTAGVGNGGNLTIYASESVELIGTSKQGLSAPLWEELLGSSGTKVFNITEGSPYPSGVITGTLGNGNAKDLTIKTGQLFIRNGAQASVFTIGAGNAGSLTVHASSIELSGTSPLLQRLNPNYDIVGGTLLTTGVGSGSIGKAGGINITTDTLSVDRGAAISVSNEGSKNAGSLVIKADSIKLDSQGRLAATTASGNGGDITLDVRDFILMRNGSTIATTAEKNGSGGNITIKSPFIIAVPNENSDIVANADRGSGGRIRINATGIYGLEKRNPLTSRSDINASSNVEGLDGAIEINRPDVDPNSGLVNLPAVPINTEVAQSCTAGGTVARSTFSITGRGGLPPNPSEALSSEAVMVDLVTLDSDKNRQGDKGEYSVSASSPSTSSSTIVEATDWVIDAKGRVELIANAPTVTPHSSWQRTTDCRAVN